MTVDEALKRLRDLGSERVAAQHAKHGGGENVIGVKLGDVRKLAKEIRSDHELGLTLWDAEVMEARLLAILVMKPKMLSADQLEELVRSAGSTQVHDWLVSYVVKKHPDKEALGQRWMTAEAPMLARAGWSLTSDRVAKNPEGLDPSSLLDRIEREMASASPEVQWTMNYTLAAIGINVASLRERAIKIGEKLGVYRDYPVSRGCTSPFAPIWIDEMVRRQQ
ncbi:MAG TPA: DNA alkylation repair protein [Spirochaetia bacterium]|nr:DNA alkylation repair protein [Spirochaetia bacterium]